MSRRIGCRILCLLLATLVAPVQRAAAQDDAISYIRDAEIENTLRVFATPIWKAAGLDPQAIHIYIVNDPTLNSFVAGGQNLFMNTGTILRADRPNEIIGIIAHETGHIAGGHLARSEQEMRNASIKGIIAMVLGAGASVLAHGEGMGGAILGGEGVAERSFLTFSVTQEASADQAGLRFLDRSHQSARGLLDFFLILQQEEFLSGQHQDPYLRTHPLTSQRVQYVSEHVQHSPYSDVKDPPEWVDLDKLMKAKLDGFLASPAETLAKYKADDTLEAARYARAVAYYRQPDLAHALPLIDGLIQERPEYPYFYELKGQMLFENGRVAEALAPYERAAQLRPDIALLQIELAQVQLESNNPALVPKALVELNNAVRFESDNPDAWRFLAVAYGMNGNLGMTALSLAEQNMANGDYKGARQQAARALKLLPPGPQRQRAQDLAADAKHDDTH